MAERRDAVLGSAKRSPKGPARTGNVTDTRMMATPIDDVIESDKTVGLETMRSGGGQGPVALAERL